VLTFYERLILTVMLRQHGVGCLMHMKEYLEESMPLNLKDWKVDGSRQPQWVHFLRSSHHSLKDKGALIGSELGEWRLTDYGKLLIQESNGLLSLEDGELEQSPKTVTTLITRRVRDTDLIKNLKSKYDNACQVCNIKIITGVNLHYSEAHHLRPLGKPHNGPDIEGNLIILCPNHHIEFDRLAIAINPEKKVLEHIDQNNKYYGMPLAISLHNIEAQYLEYHYSFFKLNLI
jgi:5-methylcytosine-specific restriction endonuclease McrA